jgi:hypothetical protein
MMPQWFLVVVSMRDTGTQHRTKRNTVPVCNGGRQIVEPSPCGRIDESLSQQLIPPRLGTQQYWRLAKVLDRARIDGSAPSNEAPATNNVTS